MSLQSLYREHGAELAPDGIPLHFGDLAAEYNAGLNTAVLFDRSHEGRLEITGRDAAELLNRMSTNDITSLQVGEARPTIFTNANARILDRVVAVKQDEDQLLLLTGPGRGELVKNYLQRNIFFNDDAKITDLGDTFVQFSLHGPLVADIIQSYQPDDVPTLHTAFELQIIDYSCYVVRLKPFSTRHWMLLIPTESATQVWQHLIKQHQAAGLRPSGGIVYNCLRIRAGVPGIGTELTPEYLPLEVGLWDEVSFSKGCYTGQEIIARMESRQQLARTLVQLVSGELLDRATPLFHNGKTIGQVTSSVKAPDGQIHTMAVVKVVASSEGTTLNTESGATLEVIARLGVQPDFLPE